MLETIPTRYFWSSKRSNEYEHGLKYSEMKFQDINTTLGTSPSGNFVLLNGIQTGTTESRRIGNFIDMNFIASRWFVSGSNKAIASPDDDLVRVLIFIDHQCNGTTPVIGDIIQSGGGNITGHYNDTNVPARFQILHDETVVLHNTIGIWGGSVAVYSNGIPRKFGEIILEGSQGVRYRNTGGTISSIGSGALWQCFVSTGITTFSVTTRLRYDDS